MASRRIEDLTYRMITLYTAFDMKMSLAGIPFIVTCTARTTREQIALYAQGRQPLEEVNILRNLARMYEIKEENNRIVTWTLQSKHLVDFDDGDPENDKSRAFDIALIRRGTPHWEIKADVNENEIKDYIEAAALGYSVGLRPGAYFRRPDYPHFEFPT